MSWESHIHSVYVSITLDPHEYHIDTCDMIKHPRVREWSMSGVQIEFDDMDDYRENGKLVVEQVITMARAITDALHIRDDIREEAGEKIYGR